MVYFHTVNRRLTMFINTSLIKKIIIKYKPLKKNIWNCFNIAGLPMMADLYFMNRNSRIFIATLNLDRAHPHKSAEPTALLFWWDVNGRTEVHPYNIGRALRV